jgi:hypothetical protein
MHILSKKLDKKERALLELIERHVFFIRGRKVMLSTHLADLYEIEPRALIQALKRNKARFPEQLFVFQLTALEFSALKSQFVISKYNYIRRSLPYAFTEQGVVALSGILRGKSVIAMSTVIIQNFVKPHRPYLKVRSIAPGLC